MEVLNLLEHPEPSGKYVGRLRAATALGMAAALVAALFCEKPEAWGQARRPEEVKAAFLFNFTRFVEWPAKAFETSESPIIIAVSGDEDVVAQLQSMVRTVLCRFARAGALAKRKAVICYTSAALSESGPTNFWKLLEDAPS
jgi:hypothetical protein